MYDFKLNLKLNIRHHLSIPRYFIGTILMELVKNRTVYYMYHNKIKNT